MRSASIFHKGVYDYVVDLTRPGGAYTYQVAALCGACASKVSGASLKGSIYGPAVACAGCDVVYEQLGLEARPLTMAERFDAGYRVPAPATTAVACGRVDACLVLSFPDGSSTAVFRQVRPKVYEYELRKFRD